jgi:hypothetical protein
MAAATTRSHTITVTMTYQGVDHLYKHINVATEQEQQETRRMLRERIHGTVVSVVVLQ